MPRTAENPLPQDVIDAANNNPFAQHEFGGLVEEVMSSPVQAQEVTIVDFRGEPDLVPGQKTIKGFHVRRPPSF